MKRLSAIVLVALFTIAGAFALNIISGPYVSQESASLVARDPAFYNNLGYALAQEGKFDDAQAAFMQAIALNDDYEKARSNLATVSFQNQDYKTAILQLRWLVAHNNKNPNYYFDLAQNLVHQARYVDADTAKFEEAIFAFETANLLSPGFPYALENAAIVKTVLSS